MKLAELWMAGLGWYRTRADVSERGGALVSEFDNEAAEGKDPPGPASASVTFHDNRPHRHDQDAPGLSRRRLHQPHPSRPRARNIPYE
jgi:hypothetical protein